MSARISLTLEASEMFLSRHMIFSLERAAVVCAILESISGFGPSLVMIAPRYESHPVSNANSPIFSTQIDQFSILFVDTCYCFESSFSMVT